jgi:hypothetical protein
MQTATHKKNAAELGLEWSTVRAVYSELRELETLRIARTLEIRKTAFHALGVAHGGQFQWKNRHATTIGDAANVRGLDDVARELANTEIPELGQDDPAAVLWEIVSAPAPSMPTADETMSAAIARAAADRPAAAPPAADGLADMIPLPEAAGLADITEQWLRMLVKAGRVQGLKIGKNYLVSRSSAEQFRRHPSAGRPRFAPF